MPDGEFIDITHEVLLVSGFILGLVVMRLIWVIRTPGSWRKDNKDNRPGLPSCPDPPPPPARKVRIGEN